MAYHFPQRAPGIGIIAGRGMKYQVLHDFKEAVKKTRSEIRKTYQKYELGSSFNTAVPFFFQNVSDKIAFYRSNPNWNEAMFDTAAFRYFVTRVTKAKKQKAPITDAQEQSFNNLWLTLHPDENTTYSLFNEYTLTFPKLCEHLYSILSHRAILNETLATLSSPFFYARVLHLNPLAHLYWIRLLAVLDLIAERKNWQRIDLAGIWSTTMPQETAQETAAAFAEFQVFFMQEQKILKPLLDQCVFQPSFITNFRKTCITPLSTAQHFATAFEKTAHEHFIKMLGRHDIQAYYTPQHFRITYPNVPTPAEMEQEKLIIRIISDIKIAEGELPLTHYLGMNNGTFSVKLAFFKKLSPARITEYIQLIQMVKTKLLASFNGEQNLNAFEIIMDRYNPEIPTYTLHYILWELALLRAMNTEIYSQHFNEALYSPQELELFRYYGEIIINASSPSMSNAPSPRLNSIIIPNRQSAVLISSDEEDDDEPVVTAAAATYTQPAVVLPPPPPPRPSGLRLEPVAREKPLIAPKPSKETIDAVLAARAAAAPPKPRPRARPTAPAAASTNPFLALTAEEEYAALRPEASAAIYEIFPRKFSSS